MQKMPKALTSLYFIQTFSTFSFAVLYSSLPLYITKQLGMTVASSNSIVGLFLALNYILQFVGGVIGGRFLSNRTLFFITIIIQSIGVLFLSLAHSSWLYIGLSFFSVGCGISITCYNNILTQCFIQQDDQRDSAFILSYGAMNVGYCVGYIASGFFDYSSQYHYLFYICMIMNFTTLCLISNYWTYFSDHNTPLSHVNTPKKRLLKHAMGTTFALLLIPMMYICFHSAHLSNGLIVCLSVMALLSILIFGIKEKSYSQKQKIKAYLILAISTLIFWMIYLTGPIGITLFIKNNVNKDFFGMELATQWIKNINPIAIILGAPLLTWLINTLKAKGFHITISMQFISSFIALALSFFVLCGGIIYSNDQGYSALYWVMGYTILQGMAELLIAPIGFALIGRIAPAHLQGVFMGVWMLISGVGASLSHYLSNAMIHTESTDPLITNNDFLDVFKQLGMWSLLAALFLYFISKKIRALIDERDVDEDIGALDRT